MNTPLNLFPISLCGYMCLSQDILAGLNLKGVSRRDIRFSHSLSTGTPTLRNLIKLLAAYMPHAPKIKGPAVSPDKLLNCRLHK